jgi:hypothetical protein
MLTKLLTKLLTKHTLIIISSSSNLLLREKRYSYVS